MPPADIACSISSLYRENQPWLRGWLYTRVSCSETAADLAQDTFVRVLAAPDAGEKVAAIREPRGFLGTIARRVLVDWIRRRTIEQAYLEALALQPEPCAVSPEERELIIETLTEIDRLLDNLGERPRQIFLMAQVDGLSYVEIGRRLDISVTTVRKHFIRAMTACLQQVGD